MSSKTQALDILATLARDQVAACKRALDAANEAQRHARDALQAAEHASAVAQRLADRAADEVSP